MTEPYIIASQVTVRPVEWLWYPFVPIGKLTALAGRMGQGKSLLTHWLAAAVTTGEGINSRAGGVVMLSAEDDDDDTIVPRITAAGADLDRVALIAAGDLDAAKIAAACEAVKARLITIDPFGSYVPANRNAYKSQDVRLVLAPIVELARARRLAVVVVQHVNRGDSTDALDRIADSQGLPQLARSVLVWGADPQDEHGDAGTRKVLTRPKANLAPGSESPAAAFESRVVQVPGAGGQPVLAHLGASDARADDVVQSSETRTQVGTASEFLRDLLATGPVAVKAVESAASDAGVSTWALRKARERCGVRSYRPGGFDGPYVWELTPLKSLSQSATNSSKQQQAGSRRWSSLVDAGREPETTTDDLDAELERLV